MVLDERGKDITSEGLANLIAKVSPCLISMLTPVSLPDCCQEDIESRV